MGLYFDTYILHCYNPKPEWAIHDRPFIYHNAGDAFMSSRKVRLSYPPAIIDKPIINQVIRRYDITINILQANVSPDEGLLDIDINGDDETIEQAISWLKRQGIEIQPIAL